MLGPLLAEGRTSEVFEFGGDAVAKVLHPHVPESWAAVEAHLTEAVRSLGLPAPAVRDVITVDGRPTVIFDRVVGPSMWQQMCDEPHRIDELVGDLARVQRMIHAAGIPTAVPSLVERMSAKIADITELDVADQSEATDLARSMPRGATLLHGDLHPGNILLGPDGLVVIDWFDASIGHPVADIVRTSVLTQPAGATDLRHLPNADSELVRRAHVSYLDHVRDLIDPSGAEWQRWEAVTAVSRLAERTDADATGLRAMWAARPDATSV